MHSHIAGDRFVDINPKMDRTALLSKLKALDIAHQDSDITLWQAILIGTKGFTFPWTIIVKKQQRIVIVTDTKVCNAIDAFVYICTCLLYTSPSPRD